MNTYGKVETLFDRDERFKVIPWTFRRPEYEDISRWSVTEKVDGTNIRIGFTSVVRVHSTGPEPDEHTLEVQVRGKTDNAQVPPQLLEHAYTLAAKGLDFIEKQMIDHSLSNLTLHGEGYGAKIQKGGGNYRPDQGFILYDVEVDNAGAFLDDYNVTTFAEDLQIPRVPHLGTMLTADIVEMVQAGFKSQIGGMAEGVVARTCVPLYDNRGERVMWKLKQKDFARPEQP